LKEKRLFFPRKLAKIAEFVKIGENWRKLAKIAEFVIICDKKVKPVCCIL
jgi:hypothetical protein